MTTEHERQHQLKKPRGFEPGIQPTKHPDKARSAFIDELLQQQRTPKENLTGVWRMRSGEIVTVLSMYAPRDRYWEQGTDRTWNSDRRSRQDPSWDLVERITGPQVQPAAPSTVDPERAS